MCVDGYTDIFRVAVLHEEVGYFIAHTIKLHNLFLFPWNLALALLLDPLCRLFDKLDFLVLVVSLVDEAFQFFIIDFDHFIHC